MVLRSVRYSPGVNRYCSASSAGTSNAIETASAVSRRRFLIVSRLNCGVIARSLRVWLPKRFRGHALESGVGQTSIRGGLRRAALAVRPGHVVRSNTLETIERFTAAQASIESLARCRTKFADALGSVAPADGA